MILVSDLMRLDFTHIYTFMRQKNTCFCLWQTCNNNTINKYNERLIDLFTTQCLHLLFVFLLLFLYVPTTEAEKNIQRNENTRQYMSVTNLLSYQFYRQSFECFFFLPQNDVTMYCRMLIWCPSSARAINKPSQLTILISIRYGEMLSFHKLNLSTHLFMWYLLSFYRHLERLVKEGPAKYI